MPRYFFIVAYSDRKAVTEPLRIELSGDAAAINSARKLFDRLRADPRESASGLTVIVKDAAGEIVYRCPSS
jgi:hypothetical protein